MSETNSIVCPVCDSTINAGEATCSRCGFKLIGSTQKLTPVKQEGEQVSLGDKSTSHPDPELFVSGGPQTDEIFVLDRPSITIGRDPKCDIFLNDMTVSREHALLTVEEGAVSVKDTDSLNGTWVDGAVVEEAQLSEGSTLQIGTFVMVLRTQAE